MADTLHVAVPRWRRIVGGLLAVVLWGATRGLVVYALATVERLVQGDVVYYWKSITAMPQVGLADTLHEYPTPVVWLLTLPKIVGGPSERGYVDAFMVAMLLLDAGLTFTLWWAAGRRHDLAVDFWIAYPVLVGPLCYARFDMIPAVLVGWALLAGQRRAWLTGALIGFGAAIKLWPALLVGAFAARRPGRVWMLLSFAGAGFGLAALSLAVGGRARLFSPLTWQADRGLQIESVWATPLMFDRLVEPQSSRITYATFKAYQLVGPGVDHLLRASDIATRVGLIVVAVLFLRGLLCRQVTDVGLGLLVLATVAVTILTNKTLSPQYLLWLGGPAAALLVHRHGHGRDWARRIGHLAIGLLLMAGLTQLIYPVFYQGLLGRRGPHAQLRATLVLGLRNLGLVLVTLTLCAWAWAALPRGTRPAPPNTTPRTPGVSERGDYPLENESSR